MARPKDPNKDVADMAEAILRLADAGEALLNSGLTRDAIVTLMHRQIGVTYISRSQIEYVLDAIPRLKGYLQ
jgi:hypothetical protein